MCELKHTIMDKWTYLYSLKFEFMVYQTHEIKKSF